MNLLLSLVVFTSNILSSFNDPFEFDGDYGEEANRIRTAVFEHVVSKEALAYGSDVEKAIQMDLDHGPTFNELVPSELVEIIERKFPDLQGFHSLKNLYGDQKIFYLFRHFPEEYLKLDKLMRDKNLPILGSTAALQGDAFALKVNLLNALLEHSEPTEELLYYWLYQSLNLHLIAPMIEEINFVKKQFASSLGDAFLRADIFKTKMLDADADLIFTQESDQIVPKLLESDFHSVKRQNSADGTFVFLRKKVWKPDYKIIPIENYSGYAKGRLNVILATKCDGEKFLLASCHGNSTRAEDGRLQITKVMEKYVQLKKLHKNLQLVIGIDANTKSEEDLRLLWDHLDKLGLVSTHVGATTVKRRMVSVQHAKVGRFAVDEEDFIITLKEGSYGIEEQTVGFSTNIDTSIPLPNINNLSDHYPVGCKLTKSQQQ